VEAINRLSVIGYLREDSPYLVEVCVVTVITIVTACYDYRLSKLLIRMSQYQDFFS